MLASWSPWDLRAGGIVLVRALVFSFFFCFVEDYIIPRMFLGKGKEKERKKNPPKEE